MKRTNLSSRAMRHRRYDNAKPSDGSSRYALKVARGQMYGPGCCGHDKK